MKKLIIPIIIVALIVAMQSCDSMKEQKTITAEQKNAIEDSIQKILPTVVTIHTMRVNERLDLILGDEKFYNSDPAQKQAIAIKTGTMILHVLGPDFGITNGVLVITKDIQHELDNPADGIKTDMKIDSLAKTGIK